MSNPNTTDTPTELALLPDWSRGIICQVGFETAVQRSWGGVEQRQRMRERSFRIQRFTRSGLTEAEIRNRLMVLKDEIQQPVIAPFWPDGIEITVGGSTSVTLEVLPITGEWDNLTKVFLWNFTDGGEFRTIDSIDGRTINFPSVGTIYPPGSFAFPCPIQIREIEQGMAQPTDMKSGTEMVTMRTL